MEYMKLKHFDFIALSDYVVGVNKGMRFIEEFSNKNMEKKKYYEDCIVTGIHVLNEDMMAVNIELE